MIPPIDGTILQNNQKFALLYTTLTQSILNPNGSTVSHTGNKGRDEVLVTLMAKRKEMSRAHILKSALRKLELQQTVATNSTTTHKPKYPSKQVSPDLIELTILLSNYLATMGDSSMKSSSSSPASSILKNTSQWSSIPTLAPKIGELLSAHLHSQAIALCRIDNPTTDISSTSRLIPNLVPRIQARQSAIQDRRHKLDLHRVELVEKVKMLSSLYHLASTLIILHLEQTVHGSVARELRTRSQYLSLTAQLLSLETKEKRLRGERTFYTETLNGAFKEYVSSLRKGREGLEERKREAERTLQGYGVGISTTDTAKVMRTIADKYAELKKELAGVKRDVEKLKAKR